MLTGILMDKFGRKKVIVIKATICTISLIPLIPLGLTSSNESQTVLALYFIALLSATFTFDLVLFGFESLPKTDRVNYVILLSGTRIIGVAIVCTAFYLLNNWVYYMIIQLALMLILVSIFAKYAFESPLQVMISSGNHDMCKYVLNSIALINDEDIVREKLAFSYTQQQIHKRRTIKFMLKNMFNSS